MKSIKLFSGIFFFLFCLHGSAQIPVLWGVNATGGIPTGSLISAGNLYSIRGDASNFIQRYFFINSFAGETAYGSLIQATNGKLYGMTSAGGDGGSGVLFSYDTSTAIYTKLVDFDDGTNDGQFPVGKLIQATNGKLYGTTLYGGTDGLGVLFSFDPSTNVYAKLLDFGDGSNDAETPFGSLVQASNGKLYGTAGGGSNFSGVLFSYDPVTSVYTKHVNFNFGTNDASNPCGTLIQAANGNLYGLTNGGGTNDLGVLYRFNPTTNIYTKLYNFNFAGGAGPLFGASLVEATNNKLYGMTNSGGVDSLGVLFSYDYSLNSYTKLVDFDGSAKGAYPFGSLIQANDGNLYGMTSIGGSKNLGAAFSYDPVATTFTKIIDFNGRLNGSNPWGDFFQASNGKLYGMTSDGGSGFGYYGSAGLVFSYEIASGMYAKKFDFNTGINGNNPTGRMAVGTGGFLYGTANGGSNGFGVLYKLNTLNSIYTKLYEFDFTGGADPTGSLLKAANGLFYGTASGGGSDSSGVIFSFDPVNTIYTSHFSFNGTTNGDLPNGGLIQASNNLFYGLTNSGGDSAYGVLYSFDPSSNIFTKLVDFDGAAKGAKPLGSLVQANNGLLYGLTSTGGIYPNSSMPGLAGTGVLFSFDPSTNVYTKLHDFGNEVLNDGAVPEGSLLKASNGKLYGITQVGGIVGWGVMFEFDPATNGYSILLDFQNIFWRPWGDLMQASNGTIYGATSDFNTGTMFEYDPALQSFAFSTNQTGGNPAINTAFVELPLNVGLADDNRYRSEINLFPNPTRGKISISYRSAGNISSVHITNMLGENIFHEKFTSSNVSQVINLDVPSGIYFITVDNGEKKITEKLIVH